MRAQNQISNISVMILCFVLCFVSACKTDPDITGDPAKLPVITSATSVTNITAKTAICGGNITDDKGQTVTARGVCWNTSIDPTTRDSITKDGSGIGTFQSTLKNLKPNTSYYVRAYATNSSGTAYGSALNFTTDIDFASIITFPVSLIKTTSATCGGNIDNDGGSPVTARGICWSSTNQNPTTSLTTKTTDGTGTGIFTSILTGLTNGTTYYVRAYATNSKGTIYGNTFTFSTAADLPTVSTGIATAITTATATVTGSISYDGGGSITGKGICWSTNSAPTITDNITNNGTGNTSFSGNLTNLTPGTLYYARAFATNSIGTGYGNVVSFSTVALKAPTVTTTSINNILAFSATGGGSITNDGGSSVTSKGICWSTSPSPTISLSTKTSDGTGSSTFNSNLSGLTKGTTYYVRAYAINAIGTSYGNEVSFSTQNGVITLSTSTVSSILAFSGVAGGNITADGGTPVTARGICYGTNSSPTINNSNVSNGSGTGSFTSNLSGLTQGTTYFVRTYATNAVGTCYGNEVSFTTQNGIITLVTTAITHTDGTSASSGASISADGGAPVISKGICWDTNTNPTTALSTKTSDGSGNGIFTSIISNLVIGTTYYVRSYATNAVGTTYGNQIKYVFGGIGYSFLGGFVFYVDGTGQHGLVCSTVDEGNGNVWTWYNSTVDGYSYPLIGASGTAIGTGRSNTNIMLGHSYEAATRCNSKAPTGTWYLPSKDELSLIYVNLRKTGILSFMSSDYWSSSEKSDKSAICIDFSTGLEESNGQWEIKSNGHYVRAIRSF